MPITPPVLDDLSYDQIVTDLVRRIPVYAPDWTDHNESDPGIALIELFAHLGEMIGYRLNRVPEVAHVELLKLLGIRLRPAHAARTRLALLLSDPTSAVATRLAVGLTAVATTGDPPPEFTTDTDHDLVPADVPVLLTTKHPHLHDVLLRADGTREAPVAFPDTPIDRSEWLDLRWDGRTPKAKDLPIEPIGLLKDPNHGFLWVGVRFNRSPSAGFRDTRVSLDFQFDDDEQPTLESIGACSPDLAVGESPRTVDWLHYWDDGTASMRRVPGRIEDATGDLSASGSVSFVVPPAFGVPSETDWVAMQEASSTDPLKATEAFSDALGANLGDLAAVDAAVADIGEVYRQHFSDAVDEVFDTLAPPPDLAVLLQTIQGELLDRFLQPFNFPDLLAVRDEIQSAVLDALGIVTCDADLQPMVDQLVGTFITPLVDLLALVPTDAFDPGDLAALADLTALADLSTALGEFRDFLTNMDLAAIRAQADSLHAEFRNWVANELSLTGPLALPVHLLQDLAGFYGNLAEQIIDDVWAGPVSVAVLTGIAEHYRTAALTAIDDALQIPPTEALSSLADNYAQAIEAATDALQLAAADITEFVDHPLDHRYRDPATVQGWLRVTIPGDWAGSGGPKLRYVGFNVVPASNASTARRSIIGSSNGRGGQMFTLGNTNVLDGTVTVSVQESVQPADPLVAWHETAELAAAGPRDRVFALDREAGVVTFGDGERGMVPPLIPGGGVIAVGAYRHGGGVEGEVPVGDITGLSTSVPGVRHAVNVVRATGGRDAEDLAAAKARARRDLATRHRAVTRSDFEWIAGQTPTVRVRKSVAVGLRRPLVGPDGAPPVPRCGPTLPAGPTGLDDTLVAHGAVSVVVVPDDDGPEPRPTESFLRAVCHHLDDHRLITTELHVVPPQYVRVCDLRVTVQPAPGFSRAALQDSITAAMAEYLHVFTGGDDGDGFGFGGQLHIADLTSRIARHEGVSRVEDVECSFTRTKSSAFPRQGELRSCPDASGQYESVGLAAEETVSFDAESALVTTVVAT